MKKPAIYLDYQSTTPLDPLVLKAMMPYLTDAFGNPHSSTHAYGWRAEAALDIAREQIATLINCEPGEIIFTSGATEANNLAIKGIMQSLASTKPGVVTCVTEHKCVLESVKATGRFGCKDQYIAVDRNGLIDMQAYEDALGPQTGLVSIMAVNNEIGVIQDIGKLAEKAHKAGALFHCDAAQAFGKIPLDMDSLPVDLMSISGHKIYGPKGVGALFIRKGIERFIVPQMDGGGQERGLRSGTQAPALVAGLGQAAEIATKTMQQEHEKLVSFQAMMLERLVSAIPDIRVNGCLNQRWVGNLNITMPPIDGDLLLAELKSLALSSGAACASAVAGPSYVLEALGCSVDEGKRSLRIGFGRFTTAAEIEQATRDIIKAWQKLKAGACI